MFDDPKKSLQQLEARLLAAEEPEYAPPEQDDDPEAALTQVKQILARDDANTGRAQPLSQSYVARKHLEQLRAMEIPLWIAYHQEAFLLFIVRHCQKGFRIVLGEKIIFAGVLIPDILSTINDDRMVIFQRIHPSFIYPYNSDFVNFGCAHTAGFPVKPPERHPQLQLYIHIQHSAPVCVIKITGGS